jgi:Mrp family chromosome partitioning ATPase
VTDVPDDRSLAALLRDVRDAWRVLAVTVLVCGLAGLLATFAQADRFAATGSVVVSPARFLDPDGTDALPALTDTVVELSSREAVLEPTSAAYIDASRDAGTRARRTREATLDWVRLNTQARRVGTSSVIEMSATGSTAADARDLVRAFVSSLTTFVRDARTGGATSADGGPVGIGLVVLGAGELRGKVSPTPLRNLFLGINAGLILGVVLALAVASRRRHKSAAQAAAELGVPSLGEVRPGAPEPGGGLFATHNLLEALSGPNGTLAVLLTGTSTGERIADVAESLARSLDRSGNRTVLVDAGGEGRALSRRLGVAERPGLLDAVAYTTDVNPLVFTTRAADTSGESPLRVLPAGTHSGVALQADGLRRVLERLRLQFNLVVISGPALEDAADLPVLVAMADCWLLVADVNLTSRRLGDVRALMERSATPMMGTLGIDGAGRSSRQPTTAA